jgi:hypothetical protein
VAELTRRQRGGLAGPASVLAPALLAGAAPHGLVRRFAPLFHSTAVELPLSRGFLITNVGRVDEGLGPFADDVDELRVVGPNVRGIAVPGIVALGLRGQLQLELLAPPGMAAAALAELEAELLEGLELGPR